MILIPVITQDLAWNCLRSLDVDPATLIVVDNSSHGLDLPVVPGKLVRFGWNIGVAHAWNIGIRTALDNNAGTLTVCSQSIVFGPRGTADLIHANANTDEWGAEYIGMGWHLNTFTRKFMQTVGFFDENFYPAYMEDTDMLYRMGLLGIPSPRENGRTRPYFTIDAELAGTALVLKGGEAHVDFDGLRQYYIRKWGGDQGHERYVSPFDSDHDVNWWPGVDSAGEEEE